MRNSYVFRQLASWWRSPQSKAAGRTRNHSRLRLEPLEDRRMLAVLSIAQENQLQGTPTSQWFIDGPGNTNIEGFATQMSVNQGQTVQFKVNTDADAYRLDIYRMGYYGGLGAREVASIHPSTSLPQNQPAPLVDSSFAHDKGSAGLVDAGNWSVSATWSVPSDATSGIYFAKLEREDGIAGTNYIVFVVRNDTGNSDLLFKTSDETWQAYNYWGNSSLYGPNATYQGRSFEVSYNRPLLGRDGTLDVFGAEYSMVRYLESNGYNVSYTTAVDVATNAASLLNHKAFLSVGHDEYWSGQERANVEAARDAGVSLAFSTGNEMFWKTYWAPSLGASSTANRTLVCYKETLDGAITDTSHPNVWTGTWRDATFSPPADGGRPENAVSGTIFMVNFVANTSTAISVPAANGKMRFWRNTSVANLAAGATATLPAYTLGGEWDEDLDNGFRPTGIFDLSSTTVNVSSLLLDNGGTFGSGTATHSLTMYRAASGAIVFASGTDMWSFGLDGAHNGDTHTPVKDVRMQQAMVNLFADMGAQPATLQSGLVAATASADHTAPISTITSPLQSAIVQAGVPITIQGTAQDGSGIVTTVDVSVDGGLSWHRATGVSNWTYSWTPRTSGTVTIKSRAVDDSGNIEIPSAGNTVNPPVSGATTFSLWNNATTPPVVDGGDANAVELGARFQTDTSGSITGLRFYKSAANTGSHTANLWTAGGQLLATAVFANETASGWQQVNFATPVAVTAGTTYVASYHTNAGHYSSTQNYFTTLGVDSGPLHALANGVSGGNGVYQYGAGGFPSLTFQASNYWVDVVLSTSTTSTDTTPPTVTVFAPAGGATNVATAAAASVTFSEALNATTVGTSTVYLRDASNTVVPTTVVYNSATNTVTLTPVNPLATSATYTIVVKGGSAGVKDVAGNALASDATSSFTTVADTTSPTVTVFAPAGGATNVATGTTATVTFSKSLNPSTVSSSTVFLVDASNTVVPTTVGYNSATNTVTLSPTSPLANSTTYTIVVKGGSAGIKDVAGNALASDATSSFTTVAVVVPPSSFSLWPASTAPAIVDSGDGKAVELGTKFTSDSNGFITGLRFYKSAANTGTHTASLWTSGGSLLATATFTGETASGWQQVNFATPVAVTTGTTYVASYHMNAGHYSVSRSYFNSQFNSGPLHVPANGGVYLYGTGGFPTSTFQASNYWVDVVLTTPPADTTPPTVTSLSPASGATNVATNAAATVTFSEALNASTVSSSTVFLRDANNVVVPTTVTYSSAAKTVTLTPTSPLANSMTYTIVAKGGSAGVKDVAGNALVTDATSSFTTIADTTPPTVTAVSPAAGATNVATGATATVTFSEALNASTIGSSTVFLRDANSVVVPTTNAYNSATRTVTLTPTSALVNSMVYTVVAKGGSAGLKDLAGNSLISDVTSSFTTIAVPTSSPPVSLWTASATPAIVDSGDANGVELGMQFTSDSNGIITGLKFYKSAANTGTHTASLWTASGQLLATATFTGETASGWQQVNFANPVAIVAGTTYVASYHTTAGHYSVSRSYFNAPFTSNGLHVPTNGGVYKYGTGGFPSQTFQASNYWVDVLFSKS